MRCSVMEDTPDETLRANVRAGGKRKPVTSSSSPPDASSSAFASVLTTVTTLTTCASNNVTLPTTTTWFKVGKRSSSDAQSAKAASRKRKRLGQAKMKRDRIQQEILVSDVCARDLQAKLTAVNKRISKLQGAQAQRPTAKQVFCMCDTFAHCSCSFLYVTVPCFACRFTRCSIPTTAIVRGQFHRLHC